MAIDTPSNYYPLTIKQNATFIRTWTWRDEHGTPINITGYKAKMVIRVKDATGNSTIELSTDNGKIVINGVAGQVTTRIEWTESKGFTWKTADYDLLLRKPDGPPATIINFAEGPVTIDPGITSIPANW